MRRLLPAVGVIFWLTTILLAPPLVMAVQPVSGQDVPATVNVESSMIPNEEISEVKPEMQVAYEAYEARKKAEEEQRQAEEAEKQRQAEATQAQGSSSSGSSGGGTSSGGGGGDAWGILSSIIAQYPILEGTVVYFQETPNGWEGCAYVRSGTILVNPNHTYPLYDIIYHEAMHILDWRQDNDIDNDDR